MRCANCEKPITVTRPHYTQVTGWVKDRKAGGINQVRQGVPTGKVLCDDCGLVLWASGRMRNVVNDSQLVIE